MNSLDDINKIYAKKCAEIGELIFQVDKLERKIDELISEINHLEIKARNIETTREPHAG